MATTVLGCPDASTTRGVAKAHLPALCLPLRDAANHRIRLWPVGWVWLGDLLAMTAVRGYYRHLPSKARFALRPRVVSSVGRAAGF